MLKPIDRTQDIYHKNFLLGPLKEVQAKPQKYMSKVKATNVIQGTPNWQAVSSDGTYYFWKTTTLMSGATERIRWDMGKRHRSFIARHKRIKFSYVWKKYAIATPKR